MLLVDQAVWSIGNAIVSILISRQAGPEALGRFSVALVAYVVAMGLHRSSRAEPTLVRSRLSDDVGSSTTTSGFVFGAAACIALALSLSFASIWTTVPTVLWLMCPALVFLVGQDGFRYQLIRNRKHSALLACDVLWTLLTVGSVIVVLRAGGNELDALVAWTCSAALAMLLVRPPVLSLRRAKLVLKREVRALDRNARMFGLEFLLGVGSFQFVYIATSSFASVLEGGQLRAIFVVFGPALVISVAIQTTLLEFEGPESAQNMPRFLRVVAALAGLTALYVVALLISAQLGLVDFVLGADSVNEALLPPVALYMVVRTLNVVSRAQLKKVSQASRMLGARAIHGAGEILFVVLFVRRFGAVGAAWGLVLAAVVAAPVWLVTVWRALR